MQGPSDSSGARRDVQRIPDPSRMLRRDQLRVEGIPNSFRPKKLSGEYDYGYTRTLLSSFGKLTYFQAKASDANFFFVTFSYGYPLEALNNTICGALDGLVINDHVVTARYGTNPPGSFQILDAVRLFFRQKIALHKLANPIQHLRGASSSGPQVEAPLPPSKVVCMAVQVPNHEWLVTNKESLQAEMQRACEGFGDLVKFTIPKRDPTSRNFAAFVEFRDRSIAKKAFRGLIHVHTFSGLKSMAYLYPEEEYYRDASEP